MSRQYSLRGASIVIEKLERLFPINGIAKVQRSKQRQRELIAQHSAARRTFHELGKNRLSTDVDKLVCNCTRVGRFKPARLALFRTGEPNGRTVAKSRATSSRATWSGRLRDLDCAAEFCRHPW